MTETMNSGAQLSDSSFWFDPHSIPQYARLVSEGLIEQSLADQYREQRREAGLPMSFDELEPRPEPVYPGFEWLAEAGGPLVTEKHMLVELGDEVWRAWGWKEGRGCLTLYSTITKGLCWELDRRPDDQPGAYWEASFNLPGGGVFARKSGKAATFAEALQAVRAHHFEPEVLGGLKWYQDVVGQVAVTPDGQKLVVRPFTYKDEPTKWLWERGLPENSIHYQIARLFGSHGLQGEAPTKEEAVADALSAPERLATLAATLVGDDQFAAGVAAGRAEVKAAIAKL